MLQALHRRVRFVGLVGRAALNGIEGTVVGVNVSTTRFVVEYGAPKRHVSARVCNTLPMTD
jgi:hypothetical protein